MLEILESVDIDTIYEETVSMFARVAGCECSPISYIHFHIFVGLAIDYDTCWEHRFSEGAYFEDSEHSQK